MEFFHLITGDGGPSTASKVLIRRATGSMHWYRPTGRLCVVGFHHLEVKELKFFPPLKRQEGKEGGSIGSTKEVPFSF